MKRFAVYGKGGIGKSTIVSNVAAILGACGKRVLVIGCDPKADSTRNLVKKRLPSVLDLLRTKGKDQIRLEDILFQGEQGVYCVESGGPEPGVGCAGLGISTTMDILNHLDLFHRVEPDVVFFDVLGDVVCGGFAMPLQKQWVEQVFIVTTSDPMALYAANNICKGMRRYTDRGQVALGGLIYNGRSVTDRRETVERFAQKLGTRIIGYIPMSDVIAHAEIQRRTVIAHAPESVPAQRLRELAQIVYLAEDATHELHPLSEDALDDLVREGAGI